MPHPPAFSLVDERQRAGEHRVRTALTVFSQFMAYQLGDHLGAAGQRALGDHHIQLREQLARQADAQTCELR